MSALIDIHEATAHDIPEILRQRRRMYEDMGYTDAAALDRMIETCRPYLAEAFANNSFHSWLAFKDGTAIGGGAVLVSPWPSHAYDLECRRATILNVYVDPEHRRRGLGRRLMQYMVDWCREEKFGAVWLHASPDGRRLYESMGFESGNEMRLMLR